MDTNSIDSALPLRKHVVFSLYPWLILVQPTASQPHCYGRTIYCVVCIIVQHARRNWSLWCPPKKLLNFYTMAYGKLITYDLKVYDYWWYTQKGNEKIESVTKLSFHVNRYAMLLYVQSSCPAMLTIKFSIKKIKSSFQKLSHELQDALEENKTLKTKISRIQDFLSETVSSIQL